MKKIYLLLLCCTIFLCGCDFDNENGKVVTGQHEGYGELKELVDWLEEESKIEETLKNCELTFLNLPQTIKSYYSFSNDYFAKVKIDKASYEFYEYGKYSISIKVSGEVLYGDNELIPVNYKIKDEVGNVVLTDHFIFAYELSKGDKFKDFEFIIYDIKPGKYTIEFYDCQL